MYMLMLAVLLDLPPGYVDATSDDYLALSSLADQYILSESELRDFIVLGRGEIAESEDSALGIVQFAFKFGNFIKDGSDVERYTYFHQPVYVEIEGQSDFSGMDVDFIKTQDTFWMATAKGPTEIKKDDFKKLFKSTQCFHPMMGPFLGARDLGVVSGFRPKIFNEKLLSGVRKEKQEGRQTFLLTIPGVIEIEREIVFENSSPVQKRDYWKNPKRELISSTKVKWEAKNKKSVPTELEFSDTQSGSNKNVSVKLEWLFGNKIDAEYFKKENLGKASLSD